MYIKPWSKEAEGILRRLSKDTKAYVDDPVFTRSFGRKYPELFDEHYGCMDIGRIDKRRKSIIALRPDFVLVPIPPPDYRKRKFTYFQFFKK